MIQNNSIWLGVNSGSHKFQVPDDFERDNTYIESNGKKYAKFGNICWFTNLDHNKRHEEMVLFRLYSPEEYPHYENYDAIEVGKTSDIPCNYSGIMGVPITFLDKYNPEQFEIVASNSSTELCKELGVKPLGEDWIRRYRASGGTGHNTANMVRIVYNDSNGKPKVAFSRIFVRNKHPQTL